eukprot:584239-Rhodomonas_salina.2
MSGSIGLVLLTAKMMMVVVWLLIMTIFGCGCSALCNYALLLRDGMNQKAKVRPCLSLLRGPNCSSFYLLLAPSLSPPPLWILTEPLVIIAFFVLTCCCGPRL